MEFAECWESQSASNRQLASSMVQSQMTEKNEQMGQFDVTIAIKRKGVIAQVL
jgi:hypothetical protein